MRRSWPAPVIAIVLLAGCGAPARRIQQASGSTSSTSAATSTSTSIPAVAATSTSTSRNAASPTTSTAVSCSPKKTVWNDRDGYGYSLCYPANWFPSGNAYANAFELRNYPADAPQAVPATNQASVLLTDTTNDTPVASERFIQDQLQRPNLLPPALRSFDLGGHHAVRVYITRPAAVPGGGPSASTGPTAKPVELQAFALYVVAGRHVIGIEGVCQADADPSVAGEIKSIEASLRILSSSP